MEGVPEPNRELSTVHDSAGGQHHSQKIDRAIIAEESTNVEDLASDATATVNSNKHLESKPSEVV